MTSTSWRVHEINGAFVRESDPVPVAKYNQVLVRVAASGVSPLDTKIRAGQAAHAKQPLPAVLGVDMAGTVEAVGSSVRSFKVGDEVYGLVGGVGGLPGTLATHIAVDAELLARKPKNLSLAQAAALPLSVITAWEGLVDRANVRVPQSVLIHAGAGGVGNIAVHYLDAASVRKRPLESWPDPGKSRGAGGARQAGSAHERAPFFDGRHCRCLRRGR